MRGSLLLLCCFAVGFLTPIAIAQDSGDKPLPEFMSPVGDLAKLKLVDGRLHLDSSQWLEAAYPASKGDQIKQLLKDKDPFQTSFLMQLPEKERRDMLLTHAAESLLNRIRGGSGARSHGGGMSGKTAHASFSSAQFSSSLYAAMEPVAHFSMVQHDHERRHLSIDDLPEALVRIEYGDIDRIALLTQSNDGRIRVVKHGSNGINDPTLKLWSDVVAPLGPELPPAP